MKEWDAFSKYEIVSYINRRTTPRRAKELLHHCLARIDALEKANASFPMSMERFAEQIPELMQKEIERRIETTQPKELHVSNIFDITELDKVKEEGCSSECSQRHYTTTHAAYEADLRRLEKEQEYE